MIDTETLFILGAGASVPYGYPTGNQLRIEIYKKFSSDFNSLLQDTTRVDLRYKRAIPAKADEFCRNFKESGISW